MEEVEDAETLAWWLAERQLPNGGLNGRPEKLEDVSVSVSVSAQLRESTHPHSPGVCREVAFCVEHEHGIIWHAAIAFGNQISIMGTLSPLQDNYRRTGLTWK
jgi:hypothetical protein